MGHRGGGYLGFFVLFLQLFCKVCNNGRKEERKKTKERNASSLPLKGRPGMSFWWQASSEGDQPSRFAQDCPGFKTERRASWEIPPSCVNRGGGVHYFPENLVEEGCGQAMSLCVAPGPHLQWGQVCCEWAECKLDAYPIQQGPATYWQG